MGQLLRRIVREARAAAAEAPRIFFAPVAGAFAAVARIVSPAPCAATAEDIEALASRWENNARISFTSASHSEAVTATITERRALEHHAMVMFNCAQELRRLASAAGVSPLETILPYDQVAPIKLGGS